LAAVDARLGDLYGPLPARPLEDPVDTLVETVLSQSTTGANRRRAFESLREKFRDWKDVRDAPAAAVEDAIRAGGLARVKTRRIQAALRAIAPTGRVSLAWLGSLDDEAAEAALTALDGVGPKTARCVLLFALGRDVFPADTHVLRVLGRIGVLPARVSGEKAHRLLTPLVPRGRALPLHLHLIRHGREVCRAQRPGCDGCGLRAMCGYGPGAK
jgi:endonuclease-3